jgi:hypothetical protein
MSSSAATVHYFMLTVDITEFDDGESKKRWDFLPSLDRLLQTCVVSTRPDFPTAFLGQVRNAVLLGGLPSPKEEEVRVLDVREYDKGCWNVAIGIDAYMDENMTVSVRATEHPLREVLAVDLDTDAKRAAVVAVIQQLSKSFLADALDLASTTEEPFYQRLLTM